jgi:hypothetical protein
MDMTERRNRLRIAAERIGGKTALGRRVGYRDGAFIGQMLRGERPITEKTLDALRRVPEVADLFRLPSTTTAPPPAPDLAEQLVDAIAGLPTARWVSVRAQLDQLAAHPEMRDDVLPELRTLLATPPSKRQRAA